MLYKVPGKETRPQHGARCFPSCVGKGVRSGSMEEERSVPASSTATTIKPRVPVFNLASVQQVQGGNGFWVPSFIKSGLCFRECTLRRGLFQSIMSVLHLPGLPVWEPATGHGFSDRSVQFFEPQFSLQNTGTRRLLF